ncbi:AAA family ATPase [Micromonospora sp. NPDC005206]|uniref:AAA family ATPase n=1 Tax=Micromonospora sp. NPDC005206 TaxID=3157022 RepID=UPI0033A45E68
MSDDFSSAEGVPEVEEPGASGVIPVRERKPRNQPKSGKPQPSVAGDEDDETNDSRGREAIELIIKYGLLNLPVSDMKKALAFNRANAIAREVVRGEMAASTSWAPPEDGATLSDWLDREREHHRYMAEGLMGMGHNVVLAGRYKTGKTTLVQNLAADLIAGRPFLGRETFLPEGSIAWLNGEMDPFDWTDEIRPLIAGLSRDDQSRIVPLHLRGKALSILDDTSAERLVEWLQKHDVRLIVLDSWRKLCVWSGVNENENQGAERLTDRIDQIKAEAGVSGFLTLAHMGRGEGEHARGATALDDWVDARWTMTSDKDDIRHLRVEGRGVRLDKTALAFNPSLNRVSVGESNGGKPEKKRIEDDKDKLNEAVLIVGMEPGIVTGEVAKALRLNPKKSDTSDLLRKAERQGDIYHTDQKVRQGRNWYPGKRPAETEPCSCKWADEG